MLNSLAMHFYEFIQLDETEQIELLWYNGEQIGRRKDQDHLILLFQVEGFYVEVFYHNKERVIKKYVSFECIDRLEPYLETIDISSVYKYIKRIPKFRNTDFVGEVISSAVGNKLTKEDDPKTEIHKRKNNNGFWGKIGAKIGTWIWGD
jgi:hypothetical protein